MVIILPHVGMQEGIVAKDMAVGRFPPGGLGLTAKPLAYHIMAFPHGPDLKAKAKSI